MTKRTSPSEKAAIFSLVVGIAVLLLLMVAAHQTFVFSVVAALIVMGVMFSSLVQVGGNARNMDR